MTTLVTANISGVLITPGGSKSVSRYVIEAATDGGRLTFDGGAIDGVYRVDIADDGTASADIPTTDQAGLLPVGARWQLVKRGPGSTYISKPFTLTGDITWDDIIETADVPYTAAIVAQVGALADDAAASAALASAITGLTSADAALAFLVAAGGSLTQDALDGRYVTAQVDDFGKTTLFLDGVEL